MKDGTQVQILRKLKHPNIIAYKDSFKNEDKLSIVMELASGGDLYAPQRAVMTGGRHARIQKQKGRCFPEPVVVNWIVQILLALKYLHDNKLLHRDLKCVFRGSIFKCSLSNFRPQNMFLTSSGVIKLGDFGVARILEGTLACAQTQIGTPFYLSPEICKVRSRSADG
jgi:NIMA (never in mitosis gene a)-related kinase 1/4/5